MIFFIYDEAVNGETGQITIDYIAGMGIFLLTVAFVFQFMYSLFIPFQSASDEVTLAADRASTVLVERLLAADKQDSSDLIDQGKLYNFNNTRLNHADLTAYNNALREVGLLSSDTFFDLNLSIAMYNNPNNPVNQSGPVLPDNLNIGQAARIVKIINTSTGYNETALVSVRVW
ncbi:MAG TPA: hypothetical protein VIO58_01645 [Candidatus Methanoperedens sp.]